MPNKSKQKSNKVAYGRKPRNPCRVQNLLLSRQIQTLATLPDGRISEDYQLQLRNLYNSDLIGTDTDLRMHSYTMRVTAATGNNISTSRISLQHLGAWTDRLSGDAFNTVAMDRKPNGDSWIFKSKLSVPERNSVSPQTNVSNRIGIKLTDIAGVLKGVTLVVEMTMRFTRRATPVSVVGASTLSTDLYQDQDVSSAVIRLVPNRIIDISGTLTTSDTVSPFLYSNGFAGEYTVTVAENVVLQGDLDVTVAGVLQDIYTAVGYSGRITQ